MTDRYDVIVVGLGPAHDRGSSHGGSRIIRQSTTGTTAHPIGLFDARRLVTS